MLHMHYFIKHTVQNALKMMYNLKEAINCKDTRSLLLFYLNSVVSGQAVEGHWLYKSPKAGELHKCCLVKSVCTTNGTPVPRVQHSLVHCTH